VDIDFAQKANAPDDVLIRVLDGESVILNLESEAYFGLDEVGTRMWTLLTESTSIQEAYDQLLAEYDVDPNQLRQDLSELLGSLVDNDLMNLHDG
jgi:hypothetical protein